MPHATTRPRPEVKRNGSMPIVGVDLGDTHSHVCILDPASGDVLEQTRLRTRLVDVERYFARQQCMRIALEVGTHSTWFSRTLEDLGHNVTVAHTARVRLIHGGRRKNDQLDAEKLARLLRYDRRLLVPIKHRSEEAQRDLAVLRSRRAVVRSRTLLVNHVRGVAKSFGFRIPKCETRIFAGHARDVIPPEVLPALEPTVDAIENLTTQVAILDTRVRQLCRNTYPETALLTQVHGVAEITALTYILTLEDPTRFARSRDVGPYLGLVPGQKQSGGTDPTRGITKTGDRALRTLLIECAQRILGKRGIDSDLKRHGLKIASVGTKAAKRRAVTAVARKLAVLLHRLWITGEVYEPLKNATPTAISA